MRGHSAPDGWCLVACLAVLTACGSAATPPAPPEPQPGSVSAPVATLARERAAEVRAAPREGERWGILGMVYEANLLPRLALECYAEARALAPEEPLWSHREAFALAALGRVPEAVAAMEACAEREARAPSLWRLGTWRLELGALEAARSAFERARDVDPYHPGGWCGLARIALLEDRADEAVEVLRRVLVRHPADAYVRQLRASALRQAGRGDDPDARVGPHPNPEPDWPDPWEDELRRHMAETPLARARRLAATGQTEDAVRLLEELLEERDDRIRVLSILAEAHYLGGDTAAALGAFERCLDVEPRNVATHINIARLHEGEGDVGAAVGILDRAIALRPDHGDLHAQRGRLLFEAGREAEALPSLRRASELDRRDPQTQLRLGRCLIALRRWSEAEETLERLARAPAPRGLDELRAELRAAREGPR